MGNNKSQKKSIIQSIVIPLFIVAILIISGNAQAISVVFSGLEPSYTQGRPVNFTISLTIIDPDKYAPININLDITGPAKFNGTFNLDGTTILRDPIISITPVSIPRPENGMAYGYEDVAVTYKYNVSIITTSLPIGSYTAIVSLNTRTDDKNQTFDSAPAIFEITSLH